MLLKLKRNSFNSSHSTASISILQYTICEDLSQQFAAAAAESVCWFIFILHPLFICVLVRPILNVLVNFAKEGNVAASIDGKVAASTEGNVPAGTDSVC